MCAARQAQLEPAVTVIIDPMAELGDDLAQTQDRLFSAGGAGERWLAVEGEDDQRGTALEEIGTGNRRWATRLTLGEYAAYRGFVASVLDDPMARFAATGVLSSSPADLRSALLVRHLCEGHPSRLPATPSDTPRVQSFGVDR